MGPERAVSLMKAGCNDMGPFCHRECLHKFPTAAKDMCLQPRSHARGQFELVFCSVSYVKAESPLLVIEDQNSRHVMQEVH